MTEAARRRLLTRYQHGEISESFYNSEDQLLRTLHRQYILDLEDELDRWPRWIAYSFIAALTVAFWLFIGWLVW